MVPRVSSLAVSALLVALGCGGRAETRASVTKPTGAASGESAAPPPERPPIPRCDLVTYNVLASPAFTDIRLRGVFELLEATNADVLALQEVSPEILRRMMAEPWVRGYHVTSHEGAPFAPGGQLVLSREPIANTASFVLPGRQRRTLLIAHTTFEGAPLVIGTTHLESFLEDGATRAAQLQRTWQVLQAHDEAVLLGDLNFGDGEEPETSALDPRFTDAWLALRRQDPGFTWNNQENVLAELGAFEGEPNRRLDRVLLASARWRADEVHIIGNYSLGRHKLTVLDRAAVELPTRPRTREEPVVDVFPSDHYGVCVTLVGTTPTQPTSP